MKYVLNLLKHPFISASAIIFFSSLLGSVLNFAFNLFMSRNLSSVDYGTFASLISLTTVTSVLSGWITPTCIHFGAAYFAKNDLDKVHDLFFKVGRVSFVLAGTTFVFLFVFQKNISNFLRINNSSLILITNLIVFFGIISIVNLALIQAKLSFKFFSFITVLTGVLKLLFGIVAVLLGFMLGGVMWGLLFSAIIPYFLTFLEIKFVFKEDQNKSSIKISKLLSYGVPAALALYGIGSLINTDILLVKHFFNPQDAGVYSRLSLVGKVIFFFSAPFGTVMFPVITQKYARKENFDNIFKLSLFLVLAPSLLLTVCYFMFPGIILPIFFKNKEYISVATLLGFFGIFISEYSLVSIMVNFYLSVRKVKIFVPVLIAAISQAGLLSLFHKNFFEVIMVSISVTFALLFFLFVYYIKTYGNSEK